MESSKQSTHIKEYINRMTRRYENIGRTKSKKRTYEETFGPREYDTERYGQEIDENFFQTHIGHAVMG